jgi:septum site-determining protein MinC
MISIKGRQDRLLVTIDEELDWAAQVAELETQLDNQKAFFAGAHLTLHTGHRTLSMDDVQDLQARVARRDIRLSAIISQSTATQTVARYLNLVTETPSHQPQTKTAVGVQVSHPGSEDSIWLFHRTLRSGQKVHHPGHVAVIGDVNPGAEIIAGGHVIVWGRLQGLVHAGATGDDSAVVCALDLSPTQLRIGSHIARPPEEKRRRKIQPEMARVSGGRIVAETWDSKKRH